MTLSVFVKIDDPAIMTALRRGASYVGVLGSRRAHAERLARFREVGAPDADLARIHAPIGLDLGGHTPADITPGILAEIERERHAHPSRGGRHSSTVSSSPSIEIGAPVAPTTEAAHA